MRGTRALPLFVSLSRLAIAHFPSLFPSFLSFIHFFIYSVISCVSVHLSGIVSFCLFLTVVCFCEGPL